LFLSLLLPLTVLDDWLLISWRGEE
jgi:hypothetical protein